jgi:NitT/TauT family transport system substrate-binding protein
VKHLHVGLVVVVLAVCVFALVGCPAKTPPPVNGLMGAMPPPAAALVPLRVGYFPNVTHAPAVLGFATARQTFAKALEGKASLKTSVFNAGPAAMEAFHAGALDMCFVGPTPAINAFAKGGDLVLIANVCNGGSLLMARKDAPISQVADLAGKKIAIPQIGNTQDAQLRHLLAQAGIKLKEAGGSTVVLPIENPDVMSRFLSGDLDAACVPEPWGSRLEVEAGAKVVLDSKPLWRDGDYPTTVLVVRKSFLQAHPDIVKAFLAALQQVVDELTADPQAMASAINDELKVLTTKALKPEVLTKALGRLQFSTKPNMAALQAMAEIMKEVGYAKTVPDLKGFVDDTYLPAAAGSAGSAPAAAKPGA